MSKNRPVHEIRSGSVKAAIWANDTRNGTMHTTTFDRRYKDGDEWRSSQSFGPWDLVHTWSRVHSCGFDVRDLKARKRQKSRGSDLAARTGRSGSG